MTTDTADLIRRLRATSQFEVCFPGSDKPLTHTQGPPDINLEAADEIEHLREALDDLLMATELPGDHCELEPAKERARAALSKARGET